MSEKAKAPDQFLIEQDFEPAYLALHRSGELKQRVEQAVASLEKCRVCPRNCDINRLANETAVCQTGRFALTSSHFPHMGEENPLRGSRGSGTIFFAQCNLRCTFCQNFDISQEGHGLETTPAQLAGMMLKLQWLGCHNINWVTPDHVVPQILEALLIAVEGGLNLPIVYNTSAYSSQEALKLLDGIVDIYMPDFKFWEPIPAMRYLRAKDYPEIARQAFREMQRQVGELKVDQRGIAKRGLLVRHLVMPGDLAGTAEVMKFLAEEVSPDTYINIMAQYRPEGQVSAQKFPELNRSVTNSEMSIAYKSAEEAGLWRFDQRRRLMLRL